MSGDASKATALASLTETYTDSEGEADSDSDTVPILPHRPPEPRPLLDAEDTPSPQNGVPLVCYRAEDEEEFEEDVIVADDESLSDLLPEESRFTEDVPLRPESPLSFHRCLLGRGTVLLPPEPPGKCSAALQEKIARLYERKLRDGKDMNASIQMRKDFRNPSIYEKLISYCSIDEMGTNYPPELYDPHSWSADSYYEELSKRQKEEMDKREKEKRTKVEFMSGTAKKPEQPNVEVVVGLKRKSKWDVGISQNAALHAPLKPATLVTPAVVPVTLPTGTKPTVISAFGTLPKKNKQ